MDEVIVRLQDMPTKMKGVTLLDESGDYNVYINARLSADSQRAVLDHEMLHIQRDDFYNELTIQEAEQL